MPAIGLGTWEADKEKVGDAIKEAIKIGYRHIDCSPKYFNEKEIGQALHEIFESNNNKSGNTESSSSEEKKGQYLNIKREDLFIVRYILYVNLMYFRLASFLL